MHVDLLTRFQAALHGGDLPPAVTATSPDEVAQRFAVYRNNVAVSLSAALAQRFPVIRRLVGEDFFAALARAYRAADPPRQPVLSEWGDGFAAFLATFPPLADWPYMADVARIEYARGLAFHAGDAAPLNPAVLADADPDRLTLHLHPSVALLVLDHPAVSVWVQNQPGAQPAPILPGPQIALILRDRSFDVPVEAISPGDAALIQGLMERMPLTQAAEAAQEADPGHNPQPRLIRLMQTGALVAGKE